MPPEAQSWVLSAVGTGIFGLAFHMMKSVAGDVKAAVTSIGQLVHRVDGLEHALGKLEGRFESMQAQREKEAQERALLREREAAEAAVLKAQVAANTKALEGQHAKNNELQGQMRELFRAPKEPR